MKSYPEDKIENATFNMVNMVTSRLDGATYSAMSDLYVAVGNATRTVTDLATWAAIDDLSAC